LEQKLNYFFFRSSAPFIGSYLRDVREEFQHKLSRLEVLIKNVDHFPNMDNSVGKSFDFSFLKEELFVAIFVLDVLCLVAHIDRRRQKHCSIRYYDRDNSQNKTKAYTLRHYNKQKSIF